MTVMPLLTPWGDEGHCLSMEKYYIIKPDGTSLFVLPYRLDFCIHCLYNLLDRVPNIAEYRLLSASLFDFYDLSFLKVSETNIAAALPL